MKDLVEFIAKSLVDDPTEVKVHQQLQHGYIRLELAVAKEDMGRVIGRNGRVANAMRVLLRAAALKHRKRVSLDII